MLVAGEHSCGDVKVREWGAKGYEREIPPTCKACLEVATYTIKPLFFDTFPEVKEYHKWVKRWLDAHDETVPCFGPWVPRRGVSHRVRQVESFTSGANAGFQSMIADITKDALRRVTREAYLDEASVLYQGQVRVPSFQHDELLSEGAEEPAHLWGPRVGEIMKEAYDAWVPDVHIEGVDTALMRFWSKEAEAVYETLFDGVSDVLVTEHLTSAGWKAERAGEAARGRRAVFGDLKGAGKLAEAVHAAGGTASEPRLTVWEPKR